MILFAKISTKKKTRWRTGLHQNLRNRGRAQTLFIELLFSATLTWGNGAGNPSCPTAALQTSIWCFNYEKIGIKATSCGVSTVGA